MINGNHTYYSSYINEKKKVEKLKETLSNVILAYSKQRKEFNIPIKPQSIIDAEKLLKSLK